MKSVLGMRTPTRRETTSLDTSRLVLEPFKGNLPDQQTHAKGALRCLEVNWDYARRGVRYRFQETNSPGDDIRKITTAVIKLASLNSAMLNESSNLCFAPQSYDKARVQYCPVVLCLSEGHPRDLGPEAHLSNRLS